MQPKSKISPLNNIKKDNDYKYDSIETWRPNIPGQLNDLTPA